MSRSMVACPLRRGGMSAGLQIHELILTELGERPMSLFVSLGMFSWGA
jgi:hypothetical protein